MNSHGKFFAGSKLAPWGFTATPSLINISLHQLNIHINKLGLHTEIQPYTTVSKFFSLLRTLQLID